MQPEPTPAPAGGTAGGTAGGIGWPLLTVLAALAALAPIATDLYLPGFPAMGADLRAGPSGVQLTLTAFLAGLAAGQLVMGPLSDRYGRRRPLVLSGAASVLAGAACAAAPNLPVLVAARLVHGLAGAGGMVVGRAVIADLVRGRAAARAFTLMLTVGGVAPVLAPLAGGLLAAPAGWRGMLWVVAGLCAAMMAGVLAVVPETRPRAGRHGAPAPWPGVRAVLGRPAYRAPVVVFSLAFAMLMAYIAASPFVYQNVLGMSAVGYGVVFGVNAGGLIAAGWLSARLVDRIAPRRLVRGCTAVQAAAAAALLVLAAASAPGWALAGAIWLAVTATGGILGNAAALAMDQARDVAGSGSAVLGCSQFVLGAVASPLAGLGGEHTAVGPAAVMAASAALAAAAARLWL